MTISSSQCLTVVTDLIILQVSLGVTVLLALTVFLLLVAETMPPQSDSVPLIGMSIGNNTIILANGNASFIESCAAIGHKFFRQRQIAVIIPGSGRHYWDYYTGALSSSQVIATYLKIGHPSIPMRYRDLIGWQGTGIVAPAVAALRLNNLAAITLISSIT